MHNHVNSAADHLRVTEGPLMEPIEMEGGWAATVARVQTKGRVSPQTIGVVSNGL